jgi:hypothetical protein
MKQHPLQHHHQNNGGSNGSYSPLGPSNNSLMSGGSGGNFPLEQRGKKNSTNRRNPLNNLPAGGVARSNDSNRTNAHHRGGHHPYSHKDTHSENVPPVANNNNTMQRIMLDDKVFLYSRRCEDPFMVAYEAESASLKALQITLSFAGSENFKTIPHESIAKQNSQDLQLTARIQPFTRQVLGMVVMIDDEKRATLRMGIEWGLVDPDEKEVDDYMHYYRLKMMQMINEAEKCNFPSLMEDPHNLECNLIFNKTGCKFIDREFLPNDTSLYPKLLTKDGRLFTTVEGKPFEKSTKNIEFKRPEEFMNTAMDGSSATSGALSGAAFLSTSPAHSRLSGNAIQVFFQDICPDDIRQGVLGNCWFLSALAAMTEFPDMILDLFPTESRQVSACGAYTVRFCKNGNWTIVRVDDFFPCYPGGGPIFSRNNENELWVLILEKAYAKLHGCYTALRSGFVHEALIDLTGAPCKVFKLQDDMMQKKVKLVLVYFEEHKFLF